MTGKKPVCVGDSAGMTAEEFARSRTGIGGSDQGALFGISPWSSLYGLWARCCGMQKINVRAKDDYALVKGHLLEPLVAEVFHRKTGFRVIQDTRIFHHADHDYLRANVDRIYEREAKDAEGRPMKAKGILEIKTTFPENPDVERFWKKGICPEHYRLQVVFYMAVLDLDEACVCCMWGFDEKRDYACIRITRDMAAEEGLLRRNVRFWEDYVVPRKRPPLELSKKPETVIQDLRSYSGFADPSLPCVVFDADFQADVEEIDAVEREIKELESQIDKLKQMKIRLEAPIVEAMGRATVGIIPGEGNDYYDVSYKGRSRAVVEVKDLLDSHPELVCEYTSVKVGSLRSDHPQVFSQLAGTHGEHARVLRIKKKKFNAATRAAYQQRLQALKGKK